MTFKEDVLKALNTQKTLKELYSLFPEHSRPSIRGVVYKLANAGKVTRIKKGGEVSYVQSVKDIDEERSQDKTHAKEEEERKKDTRKTPQPLKPKRLKKKSIKKKPVSPFGMDFSYAPEELVPKGVEYFPQSNETKVLTYAVKESKNVLLEGPTGTGKSTLVEFIAQEAGAPLITISCDVELDKIELLGKYELKDNMTKWIDGPILKAMRDGYWVVFDEINMAKPDILSVLHSLLDHRRQIIVKEHKNDVVKAHPNFRVFATMNYNYEGTSELNQAFKDRFGVVLHLSYMPPKQEIKLLIQKTGIDNSKALHMVKVAEDTRDLARKGEIPEAISTRTLVEWASAVVTNFTIHEAAEFTVLDKVSNEPAEREDVYNIIKNYFEIGRAHV